MSEWEKRQLCSDGACTGVIGADGTCKVCGKAGDPASSDEEDDDDDDDDDDYEDEDEDGEYEDDDDDEDDDEDDVEDEGDDDGHATADRPIASDDWGKRKLCSDGACTGVIGANGKCKVCGK